MKLVLVKGVVMVLEDGKMVMMMIMMVVVMVAMLTIW